MDEGDVAGMNRYMIKILESYTEAKRMGEAGSVRVHEHFTMGKHIAIIQKALSGAVGEKKYFINDENRLWIFAGQIYKKIRTYVMLKAKYSLFKSKAKLTFLSFYLAGRFDEQRVFLLTSSPRSGSTWLGNALKAISKSCLLFEPLQLKYVPEAKAAGFSWRTYVPPENEWPEGKTYLKCVFEGRVINEWTSKEMSLREALRANTMIIKFVRANRLLPWICSTFNVHSPILLIRHPCAVIASQLKSSDWNNAGRPDAPDFIKDYPSFESLRLKSKTVEENLAVLWALDQLPALMQDIPHPWIIVTYEELMLFPKKTLAKIFKAWNQDVDLEDAVSRLKIPASVVYQSGISGIDGWKNQLTTDQIARIMNVVNGFGIHFYTNHVEPDYKILYDRQLADNISKAGSI